MMNYTKHYAHHNLSKVYLNTNRVKYLLCTFYIRFLPQFKCTV